MKFAATLLVVVLACTLVLAVEEKKPKNMGKKAGRMDEGRKGGKMMSNPQMCGGPHGPLKTAESCCLNLPTLVPQANVDTCVVLFPGPPGHMGAGFAGRGAGSKPGGKKNRPARHAGPAGSLEDLKRKAHNPCVLDCVFSNLTLYGADGNIDPTLVSANFSANLVDPLKSVVDAAIVACAANVTALDKTKIPTPPSSVNAPKCKIDAKLFMNCVTRSLILNCPEKATDATILASCPAKLAALEVCNPLFIPDPAMMKEMFKQMFARNMKSGRNGKGAKGGKGGKDGARSSKTTTVTA